VRGKVKRGLNILEVGVCPPLLTAGLKKYGYEVKGVDLDPERYRSAISCLGLDVTKVDIEISPLPFESCFFDAVIFNEVFEHLRVNPIFTLRELNRVLKPCGLLIMSTPNLRSIGGILNLLLRGRGYSCATSPYEEFSRLESVGHMGHVREYTVNEVIEFLDKTGFDCFEVCFRGRYRSSIRSLATTIVPSLRPFCSYFSVKF
jgi:SAM-dependent methyltransferase